MGASSAIGILNGKAGRVPKKLLSAITENFSFQNLYASEVNYMWQWESLKYGGICCSCYGVVEKVLIRKVHSCKKKKKNEFIQRNHKPNSAACPLTTGSAGRTPATPSASVTTPGLFQAERRQRSRTGGSGHVLFQSFFLCKGATIPG